MIEVVALRELAVVEPSSPGRSPRISAASGLVIAGNHLYVVMDDEHHLGVFPKDGSGEGKLLRLFDGELPGPRKARKASKADLETLVRLPAFAGYPHGALLAMASGSRPNRRRGVALALDELGAVSSLPRMLDLSPLYLFLEQRFPALNIEGAVVSGEELCLLQRASRVHPVNACLRFRLGLLHEAIAGDGVVAAPDSITVREIDLGEHAGVALAFTDACMLDDDRIVFSAVAEATKDSYQDGPCAGAALGVLSPDGHLRQLEILQPAAKVEGVHAWLEGDTIRVLLVTDADDDAIPSWLLLASLRGESARIVGLYEDNAAAWDSQRGRDLFERPWLERYSALVAAGGSVLDIGCGMGEPIASFLIERGHALTGLDASPSLIALCQARYPGQQWVVGDMRDMQLGRRFDGLLAWHSFFHLAPEDQRPMFAVFARHAAPGAPLMFTSGSSEGFAMGTWQCEPLYHGSLDSSEYRRLLGENGFEVVDHVVQDPDCGHATIWLARKT